MRIKGDINMTTLIKTSPVAYAHQTKQAQIGMHHGMEVALSFEGNEVEEMQQGCVIPFNWDTTPYTVTSPQHRV